MTALTRLLILLILLGAAVPTGIAQATRKGEKKQILKLCEQQFGKPIDEKLNLFYANSFYVLEVSFDAQDDLEKLEVVPRYFFEDSHPDWEETDSFEYLSWVQYQNFLTRVDLITPRGKLIKPAPHFAAVTNLTAWYTSVYENAVFTVGILVDLSLPDDAPTEVRWFRLEFSRSAKDREKRPPKPLEYSF